MRCSGKQKTFPKPSYVLPCLFLQSIIFTLTQTSIQVPPANQREMVPLGSSSASMYPGYSPADIEYGKAAGEVGRAIGEMKARGEKWELPANGPEYQIGQAHGAKRKLLFKKDRTESTGAEEATKTTLAESAPVAEATEEEGGESQYFVIDTNPTPVTIPGSAKKRALEEGSSDEKKEKKEKKKKKSKQEKEPVIETEDISAEVDARLKAKGEKAKAKEEKKRRRESAGDEEEKTAKKSKKDKSKKREVEEGEEGSGDGDGKKKKRKKNKDAE
jgi:hypothetical protein